MGKPHYGEFKFAKSPAKPTSKGYAKGGAAKGQAKVAKVMTEFKSGDLRSGSKKGSIVKDPKQAMAIALSEKKAAGYKEGGKTGLWDNIHAKRERIKEGSGERMRKPGSKGAPTAQDLKDAAGKGYEGGGTVTPLSMMKDKARSREIAPQQPRQQQQQQRQQQQQQQHQQRKQQHQSERLSRNEEREMMQTAREQDMDRKMSQAEKAQPIHQRMLEDAMNPLSMMREMYDQATDRSGQSATENMKRYGMKKGGSASHDDIAKDKPMVKKMIHKHEKSMHPDKPLTKLKKGGVPVHNRNAKIC